MVVRTAHLVEIDRAAAIAMAVAAAEQGDTVLIAGKGHEDYQEIQARACHSAIWRTRLRACP